MMRLNFNNFLRCPQKGLTTVIYKKTIFFKTQFCAYCPCLTKTNKSLISTIYGDKFEIKLFLLNTFTLSNQNKI